MSPNTVASAVDVSDVAAQIGEIRGLPADAPVTASLLSRAPYDKRVRTWAIAGRETDLQLEARILATLHIVPEDTDLVALTQDLYAEQFLGFSENGTITIRSDSPALSPLQRAVVADETTSVLLQRRHDVAARAARIADPDARRAWVALVKGDTAVTAAAWSERFLSPQEQRQREEEMSALPDRIARGLPEALRADLVFPYLAGEEFVRALFATGGVAAIEQAYAAPPATTEQLLHPTKYRTRERARTVRIRPVAPTGWRPLADHSFGEFDLRRLTAVLGSRRSARAAAGWGGGRLLAWQRGSETAVRIGLVFDSPTDARQACRAVRVAHQQRSGAVPGAPDVLITPTDVFAARCGDLAVDLAVAPDRSTAMSLLGR